MCKWDKSNFVKKSIEYKNEYSIVIAAAPENIYSFIETLGLYGIKEYSVFCPIN